MGMESKNPAPYPKRKRKMGMESKKLTPYPIKKKQMGIQNEKSDIYPNEKISQSLKFTSYRGIIGKMRLNSKRPNKVNEIV